MGKATKHPPEPKLSDIEGAPISLGSLAAPASVTGETYEAFIAKFTVVSNENFELKTEIDTLKKRVRTAEILDSLIKPYADKAFIFMCSYCAFVAAVIIISGWKLGGFAQPEKVLGLMVGSTAVTVIGLVGMVLTGIFVGARKGNH